MTDEGRLPPRRRLAELMEQRRVRLGDRWTDVAARGGLSRETLRAIRADTAPIRPLSKHAIEKGLHWQPGSVDRILSGGDPVPAPPHTGPPPAQPTPPPFEVMASWLEAVAANENRDDSLRRWARSQLEEIRQIREADLAAARARGEIAS